VGVVLDSSVLVTAEREGKNAHRMPADVSPQVGNTEIALSVITLLELAHGAVRANTSERRVKRERFIEELLTALPVYPVTASVALRAGQMDGQNQARGVRLPLSDILIAVTALELDYSVATANVRHFRMIPGLSVMQF
jgi:predicted nucleic acid-binding protein